MKRRYLLGCIVLLIALVLGAWHHWGLMNPYRIYRGMTEMQARGPSADTRAIAISAFAAKFGEGMTLEIDASMDMKTGLESWEYRVVSPCKGWMVQRQMMEWLVKWISESQWPRANTFTFHIACPVHYE